MITLNRLVSVHTKSEAEKKPAKTVKTRSFVYGTERRLATSLCLVSNKKLRWSHTTITFNSISRSCNCYHRDIIQIILLSYLNSMLLILVVQNQTFESLLSLFFASFDVLLGELCVCSLKFK